MKKESLATYGIPRIERPADPYSYERRLSDLVSQIIEHLEIFVTRDFTLRISLSGDRRRATLAPNQAIRS
jgi:hypothetical protein